MRMHRVGLVLLLGWVVWGAIVLIGYLLAT